MYGPYSYSVTILNLMQYIPSLLLVYLYMQRGPIHVYPIFQSKLDDFQFSKATESQHGNKEKKVKNDDTM